MARSFQVTVTTPSGDKLVNTLSAVSAEGAKIEGVKFITIVDPKRVYLPMVLR